MNSDMEKVAKTMNKLNEAIDDDRKSTNDVNEAVTPEMYETVRKRTKLDQIKAILRHKGMDNQQFDSAISEIDEIL